MIKSVETTIGGRKLKIETGRVAKQANGSVIVTYGDTLVLVTACATEEKREGLDFLPLTVDYRENTYAAGKFPGGFNKREGKPTEKEVLTSRLIDRPIRPLFPKGYHNDTQVIGLVFSADGENDPDILSVIGASASLYISNIPFTTPIGCVRIGYLKDKLVVNPSTSQMEESLLNLVVAGHKDGIVMVECSSKEVSEDIIVEGLSLAHEEIKKIVEIEEELFELISPEKWVVEEESFPDAIVSDLKDKFKEKIFEALHTPGKLNSNRAMKNVKSEIVELAGEDEEKRILYGKIFDQLKEEIFREDLIQNGRRPDGRAFNEIRPISIEVGLLPRTHGSALFTRGETQAMVTVTLGTKEDIQLMDTLDGESEKTFMVHYNFPPFSVGEVAFMRAPGRREVGHGALAEKALKYLIPPEEKFPYTIRVVSDILESNGSSSMATVCGGSLALMDAGVPIKKAVAGIAMGLVKEGDDYVVLSDIAGFEDHYGDMDFKVAGTRDGVTALQMDIKISGVSEEIMKEALKQAKEGRFYILDRMDEAISKPRATLSPYAPRVYYLNIPQAKIKDLIGPGGKNIKAIIEETDVKIDIEPDGVVKVYAVGAENGKRALELIKRVSQEAEVGKVYEGKVKRIESYGAFVEIFPGTEGLLHISEISHRRIRSVSDVLKIGDVVSVKVIGIDAPNKIKLSIKALKPNPGSKSSPERR